MRGVTLCSRITGEDDLDVPDLGGDINPAPQLADEAVSGMGKLRHRNGQRQVPEGRQDPPQDPFWENSYRRAFAKASFSNWR
jgi:hypothetical protein